MHTRAFGVAAMVALWLASPSLAKDITTRVSVDSFGVQGNDWSWHRPSLSADGRYVAFMSRASNLVPGDTNRTDDVFVHDRQTGETRRVSVNSFGVEGNDQSWNPAISGDGRHVAFVSEASSLVPADTNERCDVFVHDRQTRHTERVSVDSSGVQANDWSGFSYISISGDGWCVAFSSPASNLVAGDDNDKEDVFVHDRQTGETTRASVDSSGLQSNDESWDATLSWSGRHVEFTSQASNLVLGDTNDVWDVFVRDRVAGETTRVSVATSGVQGGDFSWDASLSPDGRYVAFTSWASNLVANDTNASSDVFVHDRQTGETVRVSVDSAGGQANYTSGAPSISAGGLRVAFTSQASNLVPADTNGDTDLFVHDRYLGQTTRASVDSSGAQANSVSWVGSISAHGRYVAFESTASNLVPGDTNDVPDIYVRGPELTLEAQPLVVSPGVVLTLVTYRGVPGNGASLWVVAMEGTPFFGLLLVSRFEGDGRSVVSGTVPAGLGSIDVTFRGYCLGSSGLGVATNDATVSFR
jgi:Tol biopolymer transport system component